jgi:drug/metabolite transporter (DMT)-like permease
VVSVGLGAIVLDEGFSVRVAAGMVVVLLGVAMTRRQKPAVETPRITQDESVRQ